MRKVTIVGLSILLVLVALVAGAVAYLAYPGTPSTSTSLRFAGYIPLPKSGALNILDYMNVVGDKLYVAGLSAGTVESISLRGNALPSAADVRSMTGKPQTHGVVVDGEDNLAFVSRSGENTVDVFDPGSMTLRKRLPVAEDADGILYDPEHRLVYVASGNGMTGTFIDPATQTVAGTVPLGGQPEYPVYNAADKLIYQNVESTDEVVSIDPVKRGITGRWKLDGCEKPSGGALDAPQQRLWIACGRNSQAIVFDLATHRVLATLPAGGKPDTIAYDPGLRRAYAAGSFGVTTVVEQSGPGSYRVRDSIKTHPLAHTLAVDPVTHRVYIGYAGLLTAPRVAVFDPIP